MTTRADTQQVLQRVLERYSAACIRYGMAISPRSERSAAQEAHDLAQKLCDNGYGEAWAAIVAHWDANLQGLASRQEGAS